MGQNAYARGSSDLQGAMPVPISSTLLQRVHSKAAVHLLRRTGQSLAAALPSQVAGLRFGCPVACSAWVSCSITAPLAKELCNGRLHGGNRGVTCICYAFERPWTCRAIAHTFCHIFVQQAKTLQALGGIRNVKQGPQVKGRSLEQQSTQQGCRLAPTSALTS